MSESLSTYIARQAATVGRLAQPTARPVWVPQLPDAHEKFLGRLMPDVETDSIALFPDGQRLVSGHIDGYICCWELTTGVQIWKTIVDNEQPRIYGLAISPNGTQIATSSYARTVCLFDAILNSE